MARTRLAKWGNSMALRIPKPVADAAKLRPGDELQLAVDGPGSVSIRKSKKKPTLEELLRGIRAENIHSETDWGEPAGRELW
jgi:antitoxin MazE